MIRYALFYTIAVYIFDQPFNWFWFSFFLLLGIIFNDED